MTIDQRFSGDRLFRLSPPRLISGVACRFPRIGASEGQDDIPSRSAEPDLPVDRYPFPIPECYDLGHVTHVRAPGFLLESDDHR